VACCEGLDAEALSSCRRDCLRSLRRCRSSSLPPEGSDSVRGLRAMMVLPVPGVVELSCPDQVQTGRVSV
jgi:hypothetical protein